MTASINSSTDAQAPAVQAPSPSAPVPSPQPVQQALPVPVVIKPDAPAKQATIEVAVTKLPEDRHDYSSDAVSGLIGIVGAVVGAAATYWFTNRQVKKAKAEEEGERQSHDAFAVCLKLQTIYAAQQTVHQHVRNAEIAFARGTFVRPFFAFSSFANTPERVRFTTDEIIRVGKITGPEVVNVLMSIDATHNAAMDMLDSYRMQRVSLQSQIDPMKTDANGAFTFILTKAKMTALEPELNSLDAIFQTLKLISSEERVNAYEAIVTITAARFKRFSPTNVFEIQAPDGSTTVITAAGGSKKEENGKKGAESVS